MSPPFSRSAYTLAEFCSEHRISRGHLYQIIKDGRGPCLMRVGRRVLIGAEAAAAWGKRMEVETAEAAQ